MELSGFGGDLGDAVSEAVEELALRPCGKSSAKHFQHILSDVERAEQPGQVWGVRTGRGNFGCRYKVAGLLSSQLKLVLDIEQRHFEVTQGHIGRFVAEKLHQNRQTHTRAEHFGSEGVAKLMGDDAGRNADGGGDLMHRSAELGAERHAATRAREKKAVSAARIVATQRSKTIHEPADEGIYRNKALGPQFAKGHMNAPLILADTAPTIRRQIEALADAHAGVPEEQQGVPVAIVAPQQFLLYQAILFGGQWPRQTAVLARDIVGAYESGQERDPFGPSQLFENTAQTDNIVGVSHLGQGRPV